MTTRVDKLLMLKGALTGKCELVLYFWELNNSTSKAMFNEDQLQGKPGLGKIRGKKLAFETGFEDGFETKFGTDFELVLGCFLILF